MDISMFVANYTSPTDPYSVYVTKLSFPTIDKSIDNYFYLTKTSLLVTNSIQKYFLPKGNFSLKLGYDITRPINPSDIAFDPITDTYYVLFDTYWTTYQQISKSVKQIQTIIISKFIS